MTSEEEVKGQGQLRESAFRRSVDGLFAVKLKDSFSTVTPQVSQVPLVERYRLGRPVARCAQSLHGSQERILEQI